MPNFYFGNGLQSNPMDAYQESSAMVQRSQLAKLLGNYFSTGQADLGRIGAIDPSTASKIKEEQRMQGIASLFGDIYNAPEDQRQPMLAQLLRQDPRTGMDALKTFDPRFRDMGASAGQRQFESLIAGFSPEDQAKARRIAAGLDPRAVTGAMKFDTFNDAMGRPRPQRNNPTTGQVEIYVDETGQWTPLGGMTQQSAGTPSLPIGQVVQTPMGPVRNEGVDPADMEAVYADIQANGGSNNYRLPERPTNGLGVGMSTSGEAYAKEQGQQQAQLDAMARRGQLETANAVNQANALSGPNAQAAAAKVAAEEEARQRVALAVKTGQRARDDREQLLLLKEAAGLLKTATSGGLQEMGKGGARFFGITTKGAEADAKLNVVAGKLVGKVPRFEGPQSNIDVQLYQQMAGDLANPNKTRGERIAAAAGMIRLIQKYQAYNQQQAPANDGFRILPD